MISLELVNSFNEIAGNYVLIYGGIFMIISVRMSCIFVFSCQIFNIFDLAARAGYVGFTWHLLF